MIGPQTLLKASQAFRSAVPARSITIVSAPAKNKVSKAEIFIICAIFGISNFAYPTWVLHDISKKKKAALGLS